MELRTGINRENKKDIITILCVLFGPAIIALIIAIAIDVNPPYTFFIDEWTNYFQVIYAIEAIIILVKIISLP